MKTTRMRLVALIAIAIAITTGAAMLFGCSTFGTNPAGDDLLRMEHSTQYDAARGHFDNPEAGVLETLDEVQGNWSLFGQMLFPDIPRTPQMELPWTRPDMAAFHEGATDAKVVWFGHSSILMRISGKTILMDPVFSSHASPVPVAVKRFQDPIMQLDELPEIDFIVISHDHYDHLDMKTVKFFRDKKARFLVPLGVGSHLRGWGIKPERITELDWWQNATMDGIDFTCTPARHFSGRSFKSNRTLWGSWVIRDGRQSVYFSGDSGYGSHFKAIGDKYGPFDLALLETGQYNKLWRDVHMLPEEAAQAYFDLGARTYIPIHWAMFDLSLHQWFEPARDISAQARAREINLVIPQMGEVVAVESAVQGPPWWTPWVKTAQGTVQFQAGAN